MLGSALLLSALSWWPAFQPAPTAVPRPLLYESPVSWSVPETPPPRLDLSPENAGQVAEAQKISREKGPAAAAAGLARATAPELMLLRAGLKRQAGDLAGAQADYEKILAGGNRTVPRSLALSGYKNILRKRIENGEKTLYARLIQCLKDEWRNEEALALLPEILADPQVPAATKLAVQGQEALMALRLGRYDRAAELWSQPKNHSEIQWLAQTELRRGRFVEAAELRRELAVKSRAGRARSQELGAAFEILSKGGLLAESAALAEKYPELKKRADYSWRMGLAALASGQFAEAGAFFQRLSAEPKNQSRRLGARYFLARSLEAAGRRPEAAAIYSELADGVFGYYRILAAGRLADDPDRDKSLAVPLALLLETGPSGLDRDSPGFRLWVTEKGLTAEAMDQAALALLEEAAILPGAQNPLNQQLRDLLVARDYQALGDFVKRNEKIVRNAVPKAQGLWRPLAASAAARSGDYRLAVSLMSRIPGDAPRGLERWSHPLVFAREAGRALRELDLPPALLLALIRTESAYQADIMSPSNARGLMQLLPATADKVAARLNEAAPAGLALFDPGLNIRYGSWYLKALIDGFGGEEALALAGYNGGPYNIKSMILAKEGMPLDVFIESLPFEETSRYVKRIVESRYIYEMAYLGQAKLPDLTRPVQAPGAALPDF
ncbi:MAG: transglycosylase SLT domain-containing protein [Candidatus Adiutrix sp.]|jgi:soluble lytic murein transglycosylase|nr:transglycosylase SLT domain-containing protein [Candidatus Adiutrix sp.]